MSPSALRHRLPLILALCALWLLVQAPGATASGEPPQCFDFGPIELEQGESISYVAEDVCFDPEGDSLTLLLTDPPDHGTVTGPDQDGFYTYTAPSDYTGPDTYSGKANDGTSDSNVATASFEIVAAQNTPPECVGGLSGRPIDFEGRFTVEGGEPAAGSIGCSADEGVDLAFSVLDGPDHGTLSALAEQPPSSGFESATFTYTSEAAYRGPDQFTLRAGDGTNTVDVVVRVNVVDPANSPPSCSAALFGPSPGVDGRYAVEAGDPSQGGIGCSDAEGANLTFSVLDQPEHGTLSALAEQPPSSSFESATFTYASEADYRGPDQFTLRVSDGANDVDVVVKANVVEPVNDPPQCSASLFGAPIGAESRYQVEAGDAVQGGMTCSDDERANMTFSVLDAPDHGTLSQLQVSPPFNGFESASFTYTSDSEYRGPDELTLRASDGTHTVDKAVRVNVIEPVNDPPQCFASLAVSPGPDGRHPAEAGEAERGGISCSDDEGASMTFSVLDAPGHGTLSPLQDSGGGSGFRSASFTYMSEAAYRGPDQFTLRAGDGTNNTDVLVKVNVIEPVNDSPQCSASLFGPGVGPDGRYTVEGGEPSSGAMGCSDDEGADLAFSVLDAPDHGTIGPLQETAPQGGFQSAAFSYTPDTDHRGPDEFTLRATDGANNVDRMIRVTVVEAVNEPPQCSVPNPIPVEQGARLSFGADTACFDPEGDPLTLTITDQPDHGPPITGPDEDGLFTYTAPMDYSGPDSFGVEISDGVNTLQATVNVQVDPLQDDPPECFDDFVEVQQPQSTVVFPACFDPEDQDLTYTVTDGPDHGTLEGDGTGAGWTYTPNPGFTGPDSFSYKANDGASDSGMVTVDIDVLSADRLLLTPTEDTPEVDSTHTVTATVRDGSGTPQANKRVRWRIEGAGAAISGDALTNAFGQVEISWARSAQGSDQLSAYVDDDGDGVRDPAEPEGFAEAHWRAESDVEPPDAGTPTKPNGDPLGVTVGEIVDPDDPGERYFTISRSETGAQGVSACPGVPDSRAMNLPISVAIESGAGTVVAGSVSLFQVASGAGDAAGPLTPPGVKAPSGVNGTSYSFVLDCIRTGDLYVRYTLDENGNQQTFVVPIGGIVLIDPQGVVYDKQVYDQRIAAGDTPEQARAAAAISGATVTLQRKAGADFVTVLSGDPGISPQVNPQTTGADGKFQWDVSAGEYRVVVEKGGYHTLTSRVVTIPPPALDLHVALEPVDTTSPDTSITTGPNGATTDSTPTFGFSSTEAGSSFECRVDTAAFAPCSSPHTTAVLADGQHTFEVRARDAAGNTDASPATRTFTVAVTGGGTGGGGSGGGGGTGGGGDTGGGGTGGGGSTGGGGGTGGGPPSGSPCAGLTGRAQAQCRLQLQIKRKCGKLKGKRKAICSKRERAIAKCNAVKNKTKKKACLRKAKRIGAKKPRR